MKYIFIAFVAFILTLTFFRIMHKSGAITTRDLQDKKNYLKHVVRSGNKGYTYASPSPSSQLANPASVNCTEKGGTLTIMTRGDGGQFGLCNFEDDMSCEEWALYRGDCPVGGVKTTGFDTTDQMYCAWLGGQTLAVPNSQCTLPNGDKCSTVALYNGTCD